MRRRNLRMLWFLMLAVAVAIGLGLGTPRTRAAFTQYDTQTYDLDTLGVPRFVSINYIDLPKITALSKFRSNAGHDYSDATQFGSVADSGTAGTLENCRSMKHYFMTPDASVNIYAPVAGIVSTMFDESIGGTQVQITSDAQPAFTFVMFHVTLTTPLAVGDHVTEGQHLGHHVGLQTWSDIAVQVHTPKGYHLVSYFETLTDEGFAPFKARGVASRDDMIISKAYRDAHPVFCAAGTTPQTSPDADYVHLTGGAAHQSIALTAVPNYYNFAGDAASSIAATATSGLPVTITSAAPKVCSISGGKVSWRRPGQCSILFTQAGDAQTFPASALSTSLLVLPQGTSTSLSRPRLGGVFPPSASGVQSYLRFQNTGDTAGTVTISLLNGDSGQAVAKWTSPSIAPNASPQFSISDLESSAAPGFVRPRVYGLKVEPETTLTGYMQHVLYSPSVGGLTNASSCDTGVTANPRTLPYVYSSLLADFPSTIVMVNSSTGPLALTMEVHQADNGAQVGSGTYNLYSSTGRFVPIQGEQVVPMASLENILHITPGPASSHFAVRNFNYSLTSGYLQHLLTSRAANVVADMTTVCALDGSINYTIVSPQITGSVNSGSNPAAQSFLRFYNLGATAGPVTVTLHDIATGAALGAWTSPSIPPGAMRQYAVDTMERATGITRQSSYTVAVQTDIDGYFQHVQWRSPNGALSNLSTCSASGRTLGSTLIGVHSSPQGAAGYPSTVIVNNTGAGAAAATLGVYDAADGARLGSYATASIPADGQATLDISTIEAGAGLHPTDGQTYYIVKVENAFTGYLQHYVTNQAAGVVTDLTAVCDM